MEQMRGATEARLREAGVTPREREVFWEVAGRRRNREIAERLVLSERTIESHVAALLRKLGAAGRDDLVRLAEQDSEARDAPSLPHAATSFVGRELDLERLRELVRTHRLVTLVGPAGTGKTRLALQLAADEPALPPPALVDLATVPVDGDVAPVFATTLGLAADGPDVEPMLRAAVLDRPRWLVVDNAEHVLRSLRPRLLDLVTAAPSLRVLVTSRTPLDAPLEVVHEVEPLEVPPDTDDPATVLASPAGRLFADRAATARPGYRVTPTDARAVASICARLDGLPLAIELAAARVRTFAPDDLAELLTERLTLLDSSPAAAAHDRHATLTSALTWSYDLLDDDERRLLARLSVFGGEFTLDTARAVLADPRLADDAMLRAFSRLYDRSLVAGSRHPDGTTRYRLLETVREFARARLSGSGEADAVGSAHARHHVHEAIRIAQRVRGYGQLEALQAFDRQWPDIRAAMTWALESGNDDLAWELLEGVGTAWETIGTRPGLIDWLEALLDRGIPGGHEGNRARAAAACLLVFRDPERAETFAREVIGETHDELPPLSSMVLGYASLYQARKPSAGPFLEAARARFAAAGDRWHEALALQGLGLAADDVDLAVEHLTAALERFVACGDEVKQANVLSHLAAHRLAAWPDAEHAAAADRELALGAELAERTGNVHERRHVELYRACLAQLRGDHERAGPMLREALPVFRELGDDRCVARCLLGLGRDAAARGEVGEARRRLLECVEVADGVSAAAEAATARELLEALPTPVT